MTVTVFANGSLFTGHAYAGRVGAVVVRDSLVEAVLPVGAELPDGHVVDLAGGLLTPGFVDAHVHAVQGGLELLRCDLSGLEHREDYLRAVRDYADAHPELAWITGGGWSMSAFPGGTPTRADLDAVVPDRPVFLPNRDHHGAWVNSRALALAGIDRGTPDPPDGYFERDADGSPTGTLHEGAMHAVARLLPEATAADLRDALLAAQRHLHSLGITGWQDAIIGDYAGMTDPGPSYAAAARAGELSAHVVGALWWDRERDVEQIADLVARREVLTHGRFRATSVKVMQDGVPENGTASMSAPYLDRCGHATANAGHSFVDPAVLREAAPALAAVGFQLHVHAIGDAAVTETLDALEAIGPDTADLRHHVAHLQFVRPDDRPRFGRLGVAANLQSLWACLDDEMVDLVLPAAGPERASWQYPWAALLAGGARLVSGSDWPVSTPDPWQAIHVAVNRVLPGSHREAFLPEQTLTLETALTAYTSGSAWVNHRDEAGVIAPGKVADLAVHDRDPFQGPAEQIADTRVVSTWIDGRAVHQA
jgi:predicted amidohydrolase YtcJ